jgi:hypothetical protein
LILATLQKTGKLEVSGVPVLAREGLVIKNETVIAMKAYQDSEIVLVVSAGYAAR